MTFASRTPLLLLLPFAFLAAGALTAGLATQGVKLLAVEPVTLLDAAALGDDDAIFSLIAAGQDPGAPVVLQRHVFDWGPGDTTSPLLVAIAEGDFDNVTYMMKHTQDWPDPPNDQALCVVARFGRLEVAKFLMKRGAPAVPQTGCLGHMPEDLATKQGFGSLARALHKYRVETQ
jgi:hypothetical protein